MALQLSQSRQTQTHPLPQTNPSSSTSWFTKWESMTAEEEEEKVAACPPLRQQLPIRREKQHLPRLFCRLIGKDVKRGKPPPLCGRGWYSSAGAGTSSSSCRRPPESCQAGLGMAEAAAVEASSRALNAVSLVEEQSASATLEFEGTVQWEGRLTHFVANNLEQQIRRSAPTGSSGLIPAIDSQALRDLASLAIQVAAQVDELLRNVHGALQTLTTLSVGCIQTYRDSVESLGEAVDTSIRSMYTLMARCEELDKEMQPVPALARRIRDMKSALERLEGLCK